MPAPRARPISHLLFADDCLLVGQASFQNADSFRRILKRYCNAMGQKVDLLKLALYFDPKTKVQLRQAIKEQLGIAEQTRACHYLRVPIMGRRP